MSRCASSRLVPAVQAGALWGLSALYGYPAMTILNPAFAAAWAVLRWRGPWTRRAIAIALGFGIVGVVVLAPPMWRSCANTAGYSDYVGAKIARRRARVEFAGARRDATLASPYLLSLSTRTGPLWSQTNPTMSSLYCGAITVVLALFAVLVGGGRSRFRLGIAALAALSARSHSATRRRCAAGSTTSSRRPASSGTRRCFGSTPCCRSPSSRPADGRSLAGERRGDGRPGGASADCPGIAALVAIFSFARIEIWASAPGAHDVSRVST